jgi:hypothetical protein
MQKCLGGISAVVSRCWAVSAVSPRTPDGEPPARNLARALITARAAATTTAGPAAAGVSQFGAAMEVPDGSDRPRQVAERGPALMMTKA